MKKKKESKKNEDGVKSLWDNFKQTNIQIIGVPEGEEKRQEIKNLFEKITKENFPNLVKEIDIHIQEVQGVPKELDPKLTTPRHIIIKCQRLKTKRES